MKYILIIGDGMADNPVQELAGKTPLQSANIPNIDALAKKGHVGSVLTIPEGLPAGSDTAIMSVFGYDPKTSYSGRAPLEAAAMGIKLAPGDIAYRCNMISLRDEPTWFSRKHLDSHNGGGIGGEEADKLVEDLLYHEEFYNRCRRLGMNIYLGSSFRHIAVQSQAGPGMKGLKLTPPHDHIGDRIDNLIPTGCPDALLLKGFLEISHEFLDKHPINKKRREEGKLPANSLWLWADGTAVELPKFKDRYGVDGSVISAVPLCQGIAVLAGMKKVVVDGATGELDTNYEGKADAALAELENCDFVTVHVEAPDECTHNGDTNGKIQAIENIDSLVVKRIVDALEAKGEEYRMLIISDHKTLTSTRGHDGDKVPYLIYDSRKDTGAGLPYCEESGDKGEYIDAGTKLMDILFEK